MSNANVSLFRSARRLAANDNRIFPKLKYSGSGSICQKLNPTWSRPQTFTSSAHDTDPYLLVLLADQEIEANRLEQAQCLIEAAYAVYDQGRFGS